MLHAREVFECTPARPCRFGDDADTLAGMPFDEGQLPGQDPSWIAAEVGDVGHRHLGTRITQRPAQRCQSVPWNRDQDGLPQL